MADVEKEDLTRIYDKIDEIKDHVVTQVGNLRDSLPCGEHTADIAHLRGRMNGRRGTATPVPVAMTSPGTIQINASPKALAGFLVALVVAAVATLIGYGFMSSGASSDETAPVVNVDPGSP